MTRNLKTENHISSEDVLVRSQLTPNPHAVKFIVNHPLKKTGKVTYRNLDEASGVTLVEDIFNLENVVQVFLFQNSLTVTHNGEWDNTELKNFVEPIIKSRLPIHNPSFQTPDEIEAQNKLKKRDELSPERKEIEEILDRTIRPGLQADGGDLEVTEYKHPELYISFEGACGSCPSSVMGTLQAIQSILQNEFHEEIQVIPE
jgi:Fe-S cluster biogenesis protein NfuA